MTLFVIFRYFKLNTFRRFPNVFKSVPTSCYLLLPFTIYIVLQILLASRLKHLIENPREETTQRIEPMTQEKKTTPATATTITTTTTLQNRFKNLSDPYLINHLTQVNLDVQESIRKLESQMDLTSFVPLNGGSPKRILIFSTWKSGSDLLTQFFSSHPATYIHYEPFSWFGTRRMRKKDQLEQAAETMANLFACNYEKHLDEHRTDYLINSEMLSHNQVLWNHCRRLGWRSKCLRPEYVNNFCSIFPIQILKVLRMGPNVAQLLMEDKNFSNLKIVILTRDPRSTILSRERDSWCRQNTDCEDLDQMCSDSVSDFHEAEALKKAFPDNVKIIRFEDFVDNDQNQIEDLLSFVQLRLQPNMKTFLIAKKIGALSQSVQVKVKGPAKQRFADSDPTELRFQNSLKISDWRRELDPKRVMEIQEKCQTAMSLWGYNLMDSSSQQDNFESRAKIHQV